MSRTTPACGRRDVVLLGAERPYSRVPDLCLPQEKLGNEHPLTRTTRQQLASMAERERKQGWSCLNEAKSGDAGKFKTAEVRVGGGVAGGEGGGAVAEH